MGSLEKAIKTGFICRLCSEMNKVVIHIYSDVGRKLKLAERIHEYLPVTVTVQDPLPKTVCRSCIERLEQQHLLMQRIKLSHERVIMRVRGQANNLRTLASLTNSAPSPNASTSNTPNSNSNTSSPNVRTRRTRVLSAPKSKKRRLNGRENENN